MKPEQFDVIIDANSETFVEDLRTALGLKPGETIEIMTPQFTRTDGIKVDYFPHTEKEFDVIKTMSAADLKAIGCGIWDKTDGKTHWLYPGEWYNHIPEGYLVTDIFENTEPFERNVTDDDIRFGCLAFGFIQATH